MRARTSAAAPGLFIRSEARESPGYHAAGARKIVTEKNEFRTFFAFLLSSFDASVGVKGGECTWVWWKLLGRAGLNVQFGEIRR